MPTRTSPRTATTIMIVLSLLLGSLVAVGSSALRPTPAMAAGVCDTNELSCWMSRYADVIGQRPLNQVVQPGSHDTGTYNIQNYGSLARNQDSTVYQQLARGVRQFDIRVHPRTINGRADLYAYHGTVDTDVTLNEMLADVSRYTTSAGTSKEIIYLNVNSDVSSQLETDACKRYEQSMGSIALTPTKLYAGDQMKSMNEIWALPNSPRIIFDWPGCKGVSTFWNQDWSGNDSYYANQGNTPCVKYAVSVALRGRWSWTQNADSGQDIPYSYEDGNPCWNFGNVPAGSQAMSKLNRRVTGLYTSYIQQTGLVPYSALYVQRDVLTMIVDYWNRNVGSARENLNYVSADYVLDGGTSLLSRTVGLNTRSDLPKITYSYDTSNTDSTKWRYVYTCTAPSDVSGAALSAWNSNESGTTSEAVRISDRSLSVPIRGSYVLRCNDNSNRRARMVQNNRLRVVGTANQNGNADLDRLSAPAIVQLTDAYGKPMSGHYVNFTVTGPARLTADGKTTTGSFTDADGKASTPIFLTHGIGSVVVSATSPLAGETAAVFATVYAGAAAAVSTTSGDGQSTGQNQPFTDPLVVTVKDRNGNPVARQSVVFKIESGPASLAGRPSVTVTTDANGKASTTARAAGDPGVVVVSATAGNVRTTFELEVLPIVQGPGPSPDKPTADTSIDLTGPKSVSLGKTATLRVGVVNAGPDTSGAWRAQITVGDGLTITGTSLGAASGRTVMLSGNGIAADDAATFTVTVRAVHRGQVGYAALASSDSTDSNDQNDSAVKVLRVK